MAKKATKQQLNIRVSEALYRRIATAAINNGKTITTEMVTRLEHSFVQESFRDVINATATSIKNEILKDLLREQVKTMTDLAEGLAETVEEKMTPLIEKVASMAARVEQKGLGQ